MTDPLVHPPFFLAFLRHFRAEQLTEAILGMVLSATERLEARLIEVATHRPELADLIHDSVEAILQSHPAQSLTPVELDTIVARAVRSAEIMTGAKPQPVPAAGALRTGGQPAAGGASWSFATPGFDGQGATAGPTAGETEIILRQPVSTAPPALASSVSETAPPAAGETAPAPQEPAPAAPPVASRRSGT